MNVPVALLVKVCSEVLVHHLQFVSEFFELFPRPPSIHRWLYHDQFGAMANLPSDEVIAQCAIFYACIAAAGGLFDLGAETGEPPAPTQAARDLFALLGVDECTDTRRVAFNPVRY